MEQQNSCADCLNSGRADASYHVPIVYAIVKHLQQYAAEVTTVGDSRVSKNVILPPRFARVYVDEGYGSGTIGKVVLVPKHWEHWIPSDHIIRVVPLNDDIAGYLSVFLASDYGHQLISRYTYGSVVDEIDDTHVSSIPFPILKNADVQRRINELALKANQKRYEAYKMEQQALKIIDNEVIFAK